MKPAEDGFVLDCSVTMAWCFDDEATPYTEGVLRRLVELVAYVPSIWPYEVANVTLVGERRNRLDDACGRQFLAFLEGLPIIVDGGSVARTTHETRDLARAHNLSVYDAAYLELASRLDMPLATLDRKLTVAASAIGVTIFDPDLSPSIGP